MSIRSWWSRRRGATLPESEETVRWTVVMAAADWCITRAYNGGYAGVPGAVTVADVQQCADQDFGLAHVSPVQAAGALREGWYLRRCKGHLTTDAFDRQYCQ